VVSFALPQSTTKTISFIVILASAIFVARTTFRTLGGGFSKISLCEQDKNVDVKHRRDVWDKIHQTANKQDKPVVYDINLGTVHVVQDIVTSASLWYARLEQLPAQK
jgi:hypothetical protein